MVLSIFLLRADETLTELFQQLSKTPKAQKYKVLNEIKTHIVQLKTEERVEAIKALQKEKKLQKNLTTSCMATVPSDKKKVQASAKDASCNKENLFKNMRMKMPSRMQDISNMQNMSMMREIKDKKNMTPRGPKNPSLPQHPMTEPKR